MEENTSLSMILISGFKPFLNEKINPSELLVEQLNVNFKNLNSVVLPVEFDQAFVELETEIKRVKPNIIIMFGQAGGRVNISIEKVALNWNQTKSADEALYVPPVGCIGDGELALMTKFPVDQCIDFLSDRCYKIDLSFSAGTFVCNNLYFKVLKNYPEIKSVFVHTPFLPEQGLLSQPKMSFEEMYNISEQIIRFSSEQLAER